MITQVYHCLSQIEAENRDLADVWALLLFRLKLSPNTQFGMGTTSMAQLHDAMISSSQRIWDARDFPLDLTAACCWFSSSQPDGGTQPLNLDQTSQLVQLAT